MDRTDRFHVLLFAYDEKQIVPDFEDTDSTISRKGQCLLMKVAQRWDGADYRLHGGQYLQPTP
jgi:hypothetical protein